MNRNRHANYTKITLKERNSDWDIDADLAVLNELRKGCKHGQDCYNKLQEWCWDYPETCNLKNLDGNHGP